MKIPENQGPYYPAEENGQWQGNGVVLESGVPSIAGGDAGFVPAMQPPYGPPHPPQAYIPMGPGGAYYAGFAPTHPPHTHTHTAHTHNAAAPPEVFAEYMWMENQEQFDKEVMQQLEEDALMEECIEFMLEDEKREQLEGRVNGHNNRGPPNGVHQHHVVSAEQVSKSTLNPLAAEFVPTRSAATAPPAPAPHPPLHTRTHVEKPSDSKPEKKNDEEIAEKNVVDPVEKPVETDSTPEVSAKQGVTEPSVPTPAPAAHPAASSVPLATPEVSASVVESKPVPETKIQAKKTMADIVASKQAKAKSAESSKNVTKAEVEQKKEAKSSKVSAASKDVRKNSEPKSSVKTTPSKPETQKPTKNNETIANKTKVSAKKPAADKRDKDSALTRQSSETKEITSADKTKKEGDGDSKDSKDIPVVSARSEKSPSPPTTVAPAPESNPTGPKPINYAAAARANKPPTKVTSVPEKTHSNVASKVTSSEKTQASATTNQRRGSAKK